MSKQISFIHAADLHMDSPFKGLAHAPEHIFKEIHESTFKALDQLIVTAINKKVDFVLIVGDLFDNEKQSLKAQIRLRRAFEQLKDHQINVYLSYGNHDHINGNMHSVNYPNNVYIFPGEKVSQFTYEQNGHPTAAIYGFSYENRAVVTNKAQEYKVIDPQLPFHIAMLHGSLQNNTEHDSYAPFQMKDLIKQNFNYWALGHIHQREILKEDPPIVYAGNTQGRHRKEVGEKGCFHVTLTETTTKLDFIPLQAIRFNSLRINVSGCEKIHELEPKIQSIINQQKTSTALLIDLTLVSDNAKIQQWENEKLLEELIELINETLIHQQNWTYIFQVKTETKLSTTDKDLYKGEHFAGELTRLFDEVSIQPFIKDLYQHRQAKKYLEVIPEKQEESIRKEAQQLLMNELLKNGGG